MEGKVITNGESTKPSRDSILLEILNRITSKVVDGSTKAQGSETVEKKDTNPPLFHNQMGNHHMSRLHQFAFHTSEKNEVSDQQILRQFQQILGKSHFQTLGNGIQQLTLKLHPQSLGRVDITLQQVNGVLVAKLMTTTTLAKEALEGQLYQLRHAFLGQQIQVDRIEITQQQTQQFVLKDQQHSGHHDRQEEQHTQKQDNESDLNEEGEPFSFLLEETINMEV